jgi:hypothetical protein
MLLFIWIPDNTTFWLCELDVPQNALSNVSLLAHNVSPNNAGVP